jgi:hypothetical protein
MVNFNNVSEYSKSSPLKGGGEKIIGGPLYDLAKVKLIAKDGSGLVLWTRDCQLNVRELGWDPDDVAVLVARLTRQTILILSGAPTAGARGLRVTHTAWACWSGCLRRARSCGLGISLSLQSIKWVA